MLGYGKLDLLFYCKVGLYYVGLGNVRCFIIMLHCVLEMRLFESLH
jgi:hypothetical protein